MVDNKMAIQLTAFRLAGRQHAPSHFLLNPGLLTSYSVLNKDPHLAESMSSKAIRRSSRAGSEKDLWINPKSNLRGPDGNHAWNAGGNITPSSGTRFLELADIALGLKKPLQKKKKTAAFGAGLHPSVEKTEPYSTEQ